MLNGHAKHLIKYTLDQLVKLLEEPIYKRLKWVTVDYYGNNTMWCDERMLAEIIFAGRHQLFLGGGAGPPSAWGLYPAIYENCASIIKDFVTHGASEDRLMCVEQLAAIDFLRKLRRRLLYPDRVIF